MAIATIITIAVAVISFAVTFSTFLQQDYSKDFDLTSSTVVFISASYSTVEVGPLCSLRS